MGSAILVCDFLVAQPFEAVLFLSFYKFSKTTASKGGATSSSKKSQTVNPALAGGPADFWLLTSGS